MDSKPIVEPAVICLLQRNSAGCRLWLLKGYILATVEGCRATNVGAHLRAHVYTHACSRVVG